MKNFKYIIALLACTSLYSQQNYISIHVDPKMAIKGPYETSKSGELDILFRAAHTENNSEIGIEYESFTAIDYAAWGLFYNYVFNFHKVNLTAGFMSGFIYRSDYNVMKPTININNEIRVPINNRLALSLLSSFKYRTDLVEIYSENKPLKFNGYLGLIYKF